jgi:transcriptional regulator of acetoin/glycerol metabolism
VLWTVGDTIRVEDMRDALLPPPGAPAGGLLDRPLGGDFRITDLVTEVVRHYLRRALDQTHGNKSRAAELLGLPSYQTLTNWMKRHGVE